MKTLYDYLVAVDPQKFANAVIEYIDCAEVHADRLKGYVLRFLEEMEHIDRWRSDMILFGFEQEGEMHARVAGFVYEDPEDINSPVVQIHSQSIAECIYHTGKDSVLMWRVFLGMRVDMDGICEADTLMFLAAVFDAMYWHNDDGEKWEDRTPQGFLIDWLEWSRSDEAWKVSKILSKYITPGYEGEWWYLTEGISRYIWWMDRSQK